MYHKHVPKIAAAMRADADTFGRAIMFAVLSARTPFPRVPEQMKDLDKRGAKSVALWGWKADAWHYVQGHKRTLWVDTLAAPDTESALLVLARVPGLGIVKAAFVLQMLGHDVACLDVRNIRREGLNPRAYRSDGAARKSAAAFKRKAARYVAQTQGRAVELWDTWCHDVAKSYLMSPERISAIHLLVIPAYLCDIAPVSVPVSHEIPF